MIIKKGQFPVKNIEHMKGGDGYFRVEQILTEEQMGNAGRLFAWGTLQPGHSVGWHEHEIDMEVCCCVSGSGIVRDATSKTSFEPGDVNVVPRGYGHEIVNNGNEALVYLAVVLHPEK